MHTLPFETLKKKTYFYFIRHGESEGNRTKKMQGHHDTPLTNIGRDQARAAGKYFAEKKIDKIFSSPLSRALETAQLIARFTSLDSGSIAQRNELKEIDTGIFSGLSFKEAAKQHPKEWQLFQQHSWEGLVSAERIHELLQRAATIWHELIETARTGQSHLLCVSHGGILQWIIKRTMAAEWSAWLPVIRSENCGIHILEVVPLGDKKQYYAEWHKINYLPY